MNVNIIVRIDDISDGLDFSELKEWILSNFPEVPISFYVSATQYNYRWRKKDWQSIKEVIEHYNWEIGGHTRSHYHLPKLTEEKIRNEIALNLKDIQDNLNLVGFKYKITSFAYPYGEFDERVKKILKQNGIVHGLTYINEEEYKSQLLFPYDNLYEIDISCNAKNSLDDWNKRFQNVYENGDVYILCLHTSHWKKARNRSNLMRIIYSKSIKELYNAIKRFCKNFFKKSSMEKWELLRQHLNFIKNYSNVQFATFKDLIK